MFGMYRWSWVEDQLMRKPDWNEKHSFIAGILTGAGVGFFLALVAVDYRGC